MAEVTFDCKYTLPGLELCLDAYTPLLLWIVPVFVILLVLFVWLPQGEGRRVYRQLGLVTLALTGLFLLLLWLAPSDLKGPLATLLGILVTGVTGLASTTLVSNALAGLMLNLTGAFKAGDFVRVGEHFGRVTTKGLFHTEIQAEDRDLITLPNLYLSTNPVKVVDKSGTLISADVSLGYDLHRERVSALLLEAAAEAKLGDAFVLVLALDDFSVHYRVSGFLRDPSSIVSSRSRLNARVLDVLHGDGIEIMSPSVMAQRPLASGEHLIPAPRTVLAPVAEEHGKAERLMFEKAAVAARLERFRGFAKKLEVEIAELEKAEDVDPAHVARRKGRLDGLKDVIEQLDREGDAT